jgi:hypothetical protein
MEHANISNTLDKKGHLMAGSEGGRRDARRHLAAQRERAEGAAPAAESVLLARRLALSRPKRRPKPHHEAN